MCFSAMVLGETQQFINRLVGWISLNTNGVSNIYITRITINFRVNLSLIVINFGATMCMVLVSFGNFCENGKISKHY